MPQLVRSLEREVGGVSSVSASGNPFQPTFFYHGFQASPLQGTPQGLAVYVNGMRFNQPFGDTVDWDLIPDIAIDRINVVGSNPGLRPQCARRRAQRAAEGRIQLPGPRGDVSGGSFGQVQGEFQYRTSGRRRCVLRRWQRAPPERLARPAVVRDPECLRRHRLARARRRGPRQRHARPFGPERPGHLAGRTARGRCRRAQFTAPNQIANSYAAANLSRQLRAFGRHARCRRLRTTATSGRSVVNGNAPNDTPCDDDCGPAVLRFGREHDHRRRFRSRTSWTAGHTPNSTRRRRPRNAYGSIGAAHQHGRGCSARAITFVAGRASTARGRSFGATSYIGGLTSPRPRVRRTRRRHRRARHPIRRSASTSPTPPTASTSPIRWTLTPGRGAHRLRTLQRRDASTSATRTAATSAAIHNYDHFNPAAGLTYRVDALAHGLWRLRRRQPHADTGRAVLRRSGELLQPRQFLRRRPRPASRWLRTPSKRACGEAFAGFEKGRLTLQPRAFPHRPRQRHRLHQQRHAGPRLLRQYRHRRGARASTRASAHHRPLARVCRLFLHRRHVTRASFVEASGNNPAADLRRQHHRAAGQSAARHPGESAQGRRVLQGDRQWTVGAVGIVAASSAYLVGDEANLTRRCRLMPRSISRPSTGRCPMSRSLPGHAT